MKKKFIKNMDLCRPYKIRKIETNKQFNKKKK